MTDRLTVAEPPSIAELLGQLGIGMIGDMGEWEDTLRWLLIELLLRREEEFRQRVWAIMDGRMPP